MKEEVGGRCGPGGGGRDGEERGAGGRFEEEVSGERRGERGGGAKYDNNDPVFPPVVVLPLSGKTPVPSVLQTSCSQSC